MDFYKLDAGSHRGIEGQRPQCITVIHEHILKYSGRAGVPSSLRGVWTEFSGMRVVDGLIDGLLDFLRDHIQLSGSG